ncbi:cupredoxin domain-containing protein [Halorussus aquaticus]|uniref:Plastocyanin/azurin family copper-binding protein n=1 Tax=Halorussus aquaticus TaxID=2953748 RepID=A0ABD5Q433_9EURY|nr:plastocyanin/azurin family copper-binding protein [Halorussus aquaticus]
MAPDANPTDTVESSEQATAEWPNVERRPLLKALGVGAALSLGSGVAAGQQDDAKIDPNYGYAVQDPSEIPERLQPDHEVSLAAQKFDPNAEMPVLFNFEPVGLHASSGDIVQFTFDSPDHTVTSYHEALGFPTRVPDGVPPFSSPIVSVGGAWLYRFDSEGVYDLYCGPHHVLGMVMRVVVGELDEADYPAYLETPETIPPFGEEFENILVQFSDVNEEVEWVFPTPRAILTASALDPDRIQEEGTVSFGTVREELTETPAETTTR